MRLVPKILVQSLAILALSAVLAVAANTARKDPLPASPQPPKSSVQLEGQEISVKDAAMLFITNRAVFLDARSAFEYAQGHIQGAISLPPREFASNYQDIKPRLMGKDAIITYCDGERCPLGHALAEHLRGAGLKNVFVLKNGWSLWQAEKLPIEKGSKGAGGPASRLKPVSQEAACTNCGTK